MTFLDVLAKAQERALKARTDAPADWYKITAKADGGKSAAKVYIYDEIGGWFGVSAAEFVREINALDVEEIEFHINSPGGSAFDGIAIRTALKQHAATVTTFVDGLAASAASLAAMGGDTVTMATGSQMMIHDASGLCMGNADDMRQLAGVLDKVSDSYAGIYASKAGGTVAEWRDAMHAETWYTADEAVEAGLADSVDTGSTADDVEAKFDLSIFAHAGRSHAPAPRHPEMAQESPPVMAVVEPSADSTAEADDQEGAGMDPAKLREVFGLTPEASDEEVRNALALAGFSDPTPPADPEGESGAPKAAAPSTGVQMVDSSVLERLQADAAAGQEALARLVRQERDTVIAQAVSDGKFQPSRREHWEKAWDRDPEGTKQAIEGLSKGLIPLNPLGYGNEPGEREDALYAELYGGGAH